MPPRRVAVATGPADRAAAEHGVRAAYRAAGLAEPRAVLWFGSPLQAAAAALLLSGGADAVRAVADGQAAGGLLEAAAVRLAACDAGPGRAGASVREAVRTRAWEGARRAVFERLGARGWSELWALTGAELAPQAQLLTGRIRSAVTDRLTGAAELSEDADDELRERTGAAVSAVRHALLDAVLGQHDAPWLAAFETAGALAVPAVPAGLPGLGALAEVARNAGWWWPYERVVLLTERPVELHRDEAGRLDRADGPALAYPDGFELHAWRGMPVPSDFLAGLAGLTPARIRDEENAELRRVLLEHYGYDRYLADSGAEPVHRDETGVLWRIPMPDDEPVVMVEVVNSTAEPDGTFRTYWLRVPPGTRTARAGVAWTFGVNEADYHPQRET
ncbi:DUF6745 domain-containing protein [Kitasatospora sp. NPDC056138]|uniref:DUF6745 domain-containing protein n=1 Tax=Kitasatospora sp. NPDC056138 TaxID=3345724 RepID=UPI0035DCE014